MWVDFQFPGNEEDEEGGSYGWMLCPEPSVYGVYSGHHEAIVPSLWMLTARLGVPPVP